jgi:hypothetical protein
MSQYDPYSAKFEHEEYASQGVDFQQMKRGVILHSLNLLKETKLYSDTFDKRIQIILWTNLTIESIYF